MSPLELGREGGGMKEEDIPPWQLTGIYVQLLAHFLVPPQSHLASAPTISQFGRLLLLSTPLFHTPKGITCLSNGGGEKIEEKAT